MLFDLRQEFPHFFHTIEFGKKIDPAHVSKQGKQGFIKFETGLGGIGFTQNQTALTVQQVDDRQITFHIGYFRQLQVLLRRRNVSKGKIKSPTYSKDIKQSGAGLFR